MSAAGAVPDVIFTPKVLKVTVATSLIVKFVATAWFPFPAVSFATFARMDRTSCPAAPETPVAFVAVNVYVAVGATPVRVEPITQPVPAAALLISPITKFETGSLNVAVMVKIVV